MELVDQLTYFLKDKDVEILNKEGIDLLFKKAQAQGLVLEGEKQMVLANKQNS